MGTVTYGSSVDSSPDIVLNTTGNAVVANQVLVSEGANKKAKAAAGALAVPCTTTVGAKLRLAEATNNGTSYVEIAAPNSLAGNRTITLPDASIDLANLPTADQKAALAGTDGVPAAGNPYVTDSDPRLAAVAGLSDQGAIAAAMLVVSGVGDFDVDDTVTIGADTYTAKSPAVNAKEFTIGASLQATLDNLATKINTDGSESVLAIGATALGSSDRLLILAADAVGGTPVPGAPASTPLSVSITAPETADWDHPDLDATGATASTKTAHGKCVFDTEEAARLAAGESVFLGVAPFSVLTNDSEGFALTVIDSSDQVRYDYTDTVTLHVMNNRTYIELYGAGATHVAAGDTVRWILFE